MFYRSVRVPSCAILASEVPIGSDRWYPAPSNVRLDSPELFELASSCSGVSSLGRPLPPANANENSQCEKHRRIDEEK